MSLFVREFDKILAEGKSPRSGSRIFEIAGLDKSMLSRIRNGAQIQYSEIARLAAAIGSDDMIFLRLLRARLQEELTDERARRISIEIADRDTDRLAEAQVDYVTRLVPEMETAMQNIARAMPKDAGLRETIRYLGNDVLAANFARSPDPVVDLLEKNSRAALERAKSLRARPASRSKT